MKLRTRLSQSGAKIEPYKKYSTCPQPLKSMFCCFSFFFSLFHVLCFYFSKNFSTLISTVCKYVYIYEKWKIHVTNYYHKWFLFCLLKTIFRKIYIYIYRILPLNYLIIELYIEQVFFFPTEYFFYIKFTLFLKIRIMLNNLNLHQI